jgi:hypothetical protein
MKHRMTGNRRRQLAAPLLALLLLPACAPKQDHVVFVTRTSLGVDFDSEPPTAAIGYDRVEGYLGPRAEDGSVPPVLASIQSSGGAFNSDVRQTYATGEAAVSIARGLNNVQQPALPETQEIVGAPKLMFFGTSSNVGLKVAGGPTGVSSANFGYKRKEVSVIPLAKIATRDGKPVYKYPAVVASMDTTAGAQGASGARLSNAQFFATGQAAVLYGRSEVVQEAFHDRAREALHAFNESESKQRIAAGSVLACYGALFPDQRAQAWSDAQARGLLVEPQEEGQPPPAPDAVLQQLTALAKADGKDAATVRRDTATASSLYTAHITQPSGFTPKREEGLNQHRDAVCQLAKG